MVHMGKILSDKTLEKANAKYGKNTVYQLTRTCKWLAELIGETRLEWRHLQKDQRKHFNSIASSTADMRLGMLISVYKLRDRDVPTWIKEVKIDKSKSARDEVKSKAKVVRTMVDPKDIYDYFSKNMKFASLSDAQTLVLFSLLKDHPLRLNEVSGLRYEKLDDGSNYIDLDSGEMIIRNHKTTARGGKCRTYTLTKDNIRDLKCLRKHHRYSRVFVPLRGGCDQEIDEDRMKEFLYNKIQKYGRETQTNIKGAGIHTFRHLVVSRRCKELGIDVHLFEKLEELRKSMGHAGLSTTLSYYLKMMD